MYLPHKEEGSLTLCRIHLVPTVEAAAERVRTGEGKVGVVFIDTEEAGGAPDPQAVVQLVGTDDPAPVCVVVWTSGRGTSVRYEEAPVLVLPRPPGVPERHRQLAMAAAACGRGGPEEVRRVLSGAA